MSGFLVYDLKQNPEDFRVEEILRPGFIQKSGKWTIFRLHKSGWNTLDALLKISKESKVSISEIGYAGKKDRHANTSQYLSCQKPLKIPKEFANVLQLEKIGFSEKSLSPEANAGNRFVLILRNLLEKKLNRFGTILKRSVKMVSSIIMIRKGLADFIRSFDSLFFRI